MAAGALAGVFSLIGIIFALWLFIAPLIMTIQLARINRKLKEMLDRGAAGLPPQPPRI
jgi:phosphoglycerol transferase MdoB-like AlkP superfamily enzyme